MRKFFGGTDITLKDFYKLAERAVYLLDEPKVELPKADGDQPKLTVETFDNHIYFYADVDTDRCLAMMRQIREVDARLRSERVTRGLPADFPPTPIYLHIQSGGGELFAGLAIADQLAQIQTPIYSIIEGLCASAATLISMACYKRFITPSAFVLIHQFSAGVWGTHEKFKDEMVLQDMLISLMADFYAAHSKMTAEQVREVLKRDSWYNATQALELGLADEVYHGPGTK